MRYCSNASLHAQKCGASSSKTARHLQYSVGVHSQILPGRTKEEIKRVQANFAFKHIEGKIEVSLKNPAFKREEVKLSKSFLVRHVTDASRYTVGPCVLYCIC